LIWIKLRGAKPRTIARRSPNISRATATLALNERAVSAGVGFA